MKNLLKGLKDGFKVIKIIPYLIAMLCAIGAFTTSGAMEFIINGIEGFLIFSSLTLGLSKDFQLQL